MEEIQNPRVTLSPSPLQPTAAAAAATEEELSHRASLCEECGVQPFKYRCPGCSLRTCSLPCVKSHKKRTNCNGRRDRTHFIPISEFNDAHLISDYNLLEETKRVAESARKLRQGLIGAAGFKLSLRAKELRRVARTRNIDVLLLPAGMTMKKKNRSFYHRWKKVIFWTIEWAFYSTDIVLVDHGVDEHKSLRSLVENHLKIDGSWNTQKQYKLRPFRKESVDNLKFFIREKVKGTESPFRELNINCSLSKQLAGIAVLEFPIIHVVLPLHFDKFGVNDYSKQNTDNVSAESLSGLPSSIGVTSNEKVKDKNDVPAEESRSCSVTCANPESAYTDTLPVEGDSESFLAGHSHSDTFDCKEKECFDYFLADIQDLGVDRDTNFDFEDVLPTSCFNLLDGSDAGHVQGPDCGFSNEEDLVRTQLLQNMSSFDSEGRYRGDLSISTDAYVAGQDLEEGEIAKS
ncbi:Box C/D snoRNA protein 1 [Nymphaea thermarum]|nr:Box C/D snoRNA protein 1 [Nymphaea thermarum]